MWMQLDNPHDPDPKRGDLMRTAVGTNRERTWFILSVRRMRTQERKFSIWRARWWEIEPGMRLALYRSAERHGGQNCWTLTPRKARKRKMGFEELMREGIRCR